MDYRDLTLKDIEMQEKLLGRYKNSLRSLPKGSLVLRQVQDRKEYYHLDNMTGTRKYIKKDDEGLLSALTQRKITEESINRITKNIRAQEKMLRDYKPYDYHDVLSSLAFSYRSWQPEKEKVITGPNKLRPGGLIHLTSCGQKVRSKTEVMIVETLLNYALPVEYEKPLKLLDQNENEYTCYPDFTFQTRHRGKLYWEHFGMLGDEGYRRDALWKIDRYIDNGIMPSVNLIITSESSDGALDMNSIVNTVEFIKKML